MDDTRIMTWLLRGLSVLLIYYVNSGLATTKLPRRPGQYVDIASSSLKPPDWGIATSNGGFEGFVPPDWTEQLDLDQFFIRPFSPNTSAVATAFALSRCPTSVDAASNTVSSQLHSKIFFVLAVNVSLCTRNFAKERLDVVRSLSRYFTKSMNDYWWIKVPSAESREVCKYFQVTPMARGVLRNNSFSMDTDNSSCAVALPIGCGSTILADYVPAIEKFEKDGISAFMNSVSNVASNWSVELLFPAETEELGGGRLRRSPGEKPISLGEMRKNRQMRRDMLRRHMSELSVFSRRKRTSSGHHDTPDYADDEAWTLERRLAMASGDGFVSEEPQVDSAERTVSISIPHDMITLEATTAPTVPVVEQFTFVPAGDGTEKLVRASDAGDSDSMPSPRPTSSSLLASTSVAAHASSVQPLTTALNRGVDSPAKVKSASTHSSLSKIDDTDATKSAPDPDNIFRTSIGELRVLSYPVQNKFTDLSPNLKDVTFSLKKCRLSSELDRYPPICETPIDVSDWIYFNEETYAVEGVVSRVGDQSRQLYRLSGYFGDNSVLASRKDLYFDITIPSSSTNPQIVDRTVEFCFFLKDWPTSWKHTDGRLSGRETVTMSKIVAKTQSRESTGSLAVLSNFRRMAGMELCYTDFDLSPVARTSCPSGEIYKRIATLLKPSESNTTTVFEPSHMLVKLASNAGFLVSNVSVRLSGICAEQSSATVFSYQPFIPNRRERIERIAGSVWLTLVVPGAVLGVMLLLALTVACMLYKCRQKAMTGSQNRRSRHNMTMGLNSSYLTKPPIPSQTIAGTLPEEGEPLKQKGAPTIFPDEIDPDGPPPPSRPLVIDSDRDGEDTVSSSAGAGGSPSSGGRLGVASSSALHIQATPPPPNYRQHRTKIGGGMSPGAIHSSSRTPPLSSSHLNSSQANAEVSRPLLSTVVPLSSSATISNH